MKPEILLIEPMMPQTEARLDAAYQVHRLFQEADPAALMARVGPRIRAIVTGGSSGASNQVINALPALEIIAINGIGTGFCRSGTGTIARGAHHRHAGGADRRRGRHGDRPDTRGGAADLPWRPLRARGKLAERKRPAGTEGQWQAAGHHRARPRVTGG